MTKIKQIAKRTCKIIAEIFSTSAFWFVYIINLATE